MVYALEVAVAILAVIGLGGLWWLVRGLLQVPEGEGVYLVTLPARGDGGDLEGRLRHLLWLRSNGLLPCRVVIRDEGLDADGLALAQALTAELGAMTEETT